MPIVATVSLAVAPLQVASAPHPLCRSLVVAFSEGGNARHFFFGPLFVAGSRLQAMLFQSFKLAHSAKLRIQTGKTKENAITAHLAKWMLLG